MVDLRVTWPLHEIEKYLDSDSDEPPKARRSVTKPSVLPGKMPSAGVQTGKGGSGRRGPKKDLTVPGTVMKFQPPDFNDNSGHIRMGCAPAFSDRPLTGGKKIASKGPDNHRVGFSPRSVLSQAHEAPEVRRLRETMAAGKKKPKPRAKLQKLPGVKEPI
jgi:hypothetical protein